MENQEGRERLELEKLKQEITALKRPAYHNPALWISSSTAAVAIVALLFQYFSFENQQVLAQAKLIQAQNQLHDVSRVVDSLETEIADKNARIRAADSMFSSVRRAIESDRVLSKQVWHEITSGLNLMYNEVDRDSDSILCSTVYSDGKGEVTGELWLTNRGNFVLITFPRYTLSNHGEGIRRKAPATSRPVTRQFAELFLKEKCSQQ